MKIVHALLSLDCGGLERIVVSLIRHGIQSGQDITVLCLERPGTLADEVEALGVHVICANKPAGLHFGLVNELRSILRDLEPDVVHTHQIGVLFYLGPAACTAGVRRVVHTEHGKQYRDRKKRWLGRFAAQWASEFICVSRDIADEAIAQGVVPRRKVSLVANGIDVQPLSEQSEVDALRRSLGISPTTQVIGTLGRLSPVKQHDSLIRVFEKVHAKLPDTALLIVGDGPRMAELRSLVTAMGLSESVHLVGYQSEPSVYLQLMNVFALTSRSEGMPLAILEAWAANVAVASYRVGGVPELVDEQTGVLVHPNDEAGLAGAIVQLLSSPDRRAEIAEASSQRLHSRYTIERMASEYEQRYRDSAIATTSNRDADTCAFS